MKNIAGILTFIFIMSSAAFATASEEPAYCNPQTFFSNEVKIDETINKKLKRARMFKLGDVQLVGLAVGNSKNQQVIDLATTQSTVEQNENFCTWFLNKGDSAAEASFNHYYMKDPKSLNTETGPVLYREILKNQFANGSPSFLSCLQNHKYLALGCKGQRHRGPTVVGMLLSYSGCSPQNAYTIVNTLWGLNGVKEATRLAIIAEGKKMGDEDPEARRRMQQAFGHSH